MPTSEEQGCKLSPQEIDEKAKNLDKDALDFFKTEDSASAARKFHNEVLDTQQQHGSRCNEMIFAKVQSNNKAWNAQLAVATQISENDGNKQLSTSFGHSRRNISEQTGLISVNIADNRVSTDAKTPLNSISLSSAIRKLEH